MFDDDEHIDVRSVADAHSNLRLAEEKLAEAQKKVSGAKEQVLRAELERLKTAYPALERVGCSAYWEYDDQSSYYWAVSLRVEPEEALSEIVIETRTSYGGRTYAITACDEILDRDSDDILKDVDAWCSVAGVDEPDDGKTIWIDL